MLRCIIISITLLPLLMPSAFAETPFADIHIHYNWDQAEIISAQEVVNKLKATETRLTIVSSTPTHLALELRKQGGDWILPFFSPYTHETGKRDWYLDQNLIKKAEQGLKNKDYYGIGEIHFMAGFAPKPDNKNFQALMALAELYGVPALIHVDAGNENYFMDICRTYPKVKILFAHAGGNLYPQHIKKIIQSCPNVWVDFSARDPWRYGGLTDDQHELLNGWRQLLLEFPDRFLTGTDAVWRVTRTQSWDQSDDGWDYYEQLYDFHQNWINALPEHVQKKVRWENAIDILSLR
ncbi:MAG: hypothetical protein EP297_09215 [Gammaproteobacteria bacterium]|nr:MAG: hypothetical protein EP297_09215 [Gammaproteobacteria bacterium]